MFWPGVQPRNVFLSPDCLDDFVIGGLARAAQTDPETVKQILQTNLFFRGGSAVRPYLLWLNLAWLVPLLIQWRIVSSKSRRASNIHKISFHRG